MLKRERGTLPAAEHVSLFLTLYLLPLLIIPLLTATPRDEETVKKDEQLAALSFNLTTPTQPPSSVQSSTSTDAPVFTFGGSQSDAVPAFSVGTATPQVPTNLPTTFEFGK